MLRTIKYKKDASLKEINPNLKACENNVVSILTPNGWKIPEEGDFIKETSPNQWNVISKSEIKELAYNLNNIVSSGSGIDMINQYYLNTFGLQVLGLAISEVFDNLIEADYKDLGKLINLHKLSSWLFRKMVYEE